LILYHYLNIFVKDQFGVSMIKYVFYSLIMIIIISSCSEQVEETQPKYEELIFNVDTTLLGKKVLVKSAGIVFSTPKGYDQMDPEMFQNLKQSMLNIEGFRHFPMLAAISESQQGIMLFLKLFPEDTTIDHITFQQVEKVLQPKDTSIKVKKHFFTKDSINILQFIVDTGKLLDFKLFFHDKDSNLYEIDYIFINKEEYRKDLKAVESSIGSLKINL